MSIRDLILRPFELRYTEVEIPVLGTKVRIRNISEAERGRIEALQAMARTEEDRVQAAREEPCRFIIACVVNEQGERLFTLKDLPQLMAQDSSITRPLFYGIREHCGTGPGAKSVEDHEKNCEATGDDSSGGT